MYLEEFGREVDTFARGLVVHELLIGVVAGETSVDNFDIVAAEQNGILVKNGIFQSIVLDVDEGFDGLLEELADLVLSEILAILEFVLDD